MGIQPWPAVKSGGPSLSDPCRGTVGSPAVTLNCTLLPPTEGRKKVAPNLGAESEDQGTSTAFTGLQGASHA